MNWFVRTVIVGSVIVAIFNAMRNNDSKAIYHMLFAIWATVFAALVT